VIVGVISDTHNLLRPEARAALQGVDAIIHAGDIGSPEILTDLLNLAPVYAVHGNCDRYPLTEDLRDREIFYLAGIQVFVTHIGGRPQEMRRYYPEIKGCQLVVFGHSHRASVQIDDGIVFFNPGAAGPRRFSLPVTVGKVMIEDGRIDAEVIEIA
jgi:putative phosphoesterase